MEWRDAKRKEDGSYVIPERWLHLHYYEALNILFRFENSLRVLVYAMLKNETQEAWANASFGSESNSISSIAKKRISQAQSFGYLGYEVSCPVMHLTSGELVDLITSDAHWKTFKRYFRGTRDVIRTKFLEIGTVRNALAHFRPIKPEDIELLKQNTRHTLIGVEEVLWALFNSNEIVATNTDEPWYKALRSLGSEYATTQLLHSENEAWVRVALSYMMPILTPGYVTSHYRLENVGNLKTREIIFQFPVIGKYVTSVTEKVLSKVENDGALQRVEKHASFTFAKNVIVNNIDEIQEAFKALHLRIAEEAELLSQDEQARGTLLEPKRFTIVYRKSGDRGYWESGDSQLQYPVCPSDPPEYWGTLKMWDNDIVSAATIYPWMQSEISDDEIPF